MKHAVDTGVNCFTRGETKLERYLTKGLRNNL